VAGPAQQGKSSLINFLAKKDLAKIGDGFNPETMDHMCYREQNGRVFIDSRGVFERNDKKGSIKQLEATIRECRPDLTLVVVKRDILATDSVPESIKTVRALLQKQKLKTKTLLIVTNCSSILPLDPQKVMALANKPIDLQRYVQETQERQNKDRKEMYEKLGETIKSNNIIDKYGFCNLPAKIEGGTRKLDFEACEPPGDTLRELIADNLPSNVELDLESNVEAQLIRYGQSVIRSFSALNSAISLMPGVDVVLTLYTTTKMVKMLSLCSKSKELTYETFFAKERIFFGSATLVRTLALAALIPLEAFSYIIPIGSPIVMGLGVVFSGVTTRVIGVRAFNYFMGMEALSTMNL